MGRAAILQSNYIPWKGYFDLIASVDTFILYDDMQYTKRDWRNRNRIKTANGPIWMSIPVKVKGRYFQKINETEISDLTWPTSHWHQLTQHYRKSPFFDEISEWLQPLYQNPLGENLSTINRAFITAICSYLNIDTKIIDSRDLDLIDGKSERLADLCKQVGCSEYVSGPAAKDYIDLSVFDQYGVSLAWADYSNYPEYPQLWGEFEHSVTVLDLLFSMGKNSHRYMKYLTK